MVTFKEWIFNEMPHFSVLSGETFSVVTQYGLQHFNQSKRPDSQEVNIIDMRGEDYKKNPVVDKNGDMKGIILPNEFSAPLANDKYLNWDGMNPTFDDHQKYTAIRKDWAEFAEFANKNGTVKPPKFERDAEKEYYASINNKHR